ncbi:cell envelope integrity protein TolA [Psychromonas antarctica]|jgi:colicin import membrane protein|uniref:cell envelope integrity protein TolA n=1 Tax=Psychromonas antarctica TaxID=67573 RepID=UPI001EE7C364|nr:cell envelope integrity protein TolA [Psychromonas antarctica]MCG6202430.1 cell envelope integrity protein TolA [Psychromonas antarctica]
MKKSSLLIAFISALSLHLIVGGLLLNNIDFSLPKEKPLTPIINASVVSQKMFDDLAQRKDAKELAEQRRKDLLIKEQERIKREKQNAEKKRKKRESEKRAAEKAEVQRQKKEVERIQTEKILAAKQLKAQKEADKAKKIENEKREKREKQQAEQALADKKVREKREKIEAERIQAEKVAKQKALAEAKEKAEKEIKRKAEAEKERQRQAELDKQMAAEFADEFSSAQNAKQLSEIARYKALIQDKIGRNWQLDPDMKGKTCTLAIRLAPDGLVLSVNRSRGDTKLCDSAKRAALKAKTLPIPKDSEIAPQFRDFDITLEPDL